MHATTHSVQPVNVIGSIFGRLFALAGAAVVGAFAFALMAFVTERSMEVFVAVPFVAGVILVVGLPGFLVLRFALYAFNKSSVSWFAGAGMVNGITFGVFLFWPLSETEATTSFFLLIAAVVGAVTGAVYCVLEKGLSSGTGDRE